MFRSPTRAPSARMAGLGSGSCSRVSATRRRRLMASSKAFRSKGSSRRCASASLSSGTRKEAGTTPSKRPEYSARASAPRSRTSSHIPFTASMAPATSSAALGIWARYSPLMAVRSTVLSTVGQSTAAMRRGSVGGPWTGGCSGQKTANSITGVMAQNGPTISADKACRVRSMSTTSPAEAAARRASKLGGRIHIPPSQVISEATRAPPTAATQTHQPRSLNHHHATKPMTRPLRADSSTNSASVEKTSARPRSDRLAPSS